MSKKYKDFTEHTWLVRVRHCKQFKTFKDCILNPYPFRRMMQLYTLKGLNLFYPFNTKFAAYTLNEMRKKLTKGNLNITLYTIKTSAIFHLLSGKTSRSCLYFRAAATVTLLLLLRDFLLQYG